MPVSGEAGQSAEHGEGGAARLATSVVSSKAQAIKALCTMRMSSWLSQTRTFGQSDHDGSLPLVSSVPGADPAALVQIEPAQGAFEVVEARLVVRFDMNVGGT
jgi:hypothetical protein